MHHAIGVDDQCAAAIGIDPQMNARFLVFVLFDIMIKL